jgi:hypothetical protein
MTDADVKRLIAERKITRVEPDSVTALEEIATARRHIAAAATIAELDPTLAFTGLYDAMRKAIQAHMRASGYRISKGAGGHRKTGEYALAALDTLDIGPHLDEFDVLRQLRNQSEYEALFVQSNDVEQALEHAQAIVDAVAAVLPG